MRFLLLSGVGRTVIAVILAIIILLAMICIHEFGHFIAGRILHFKINEFSVGFGPALFKRKSKKNGTLFAVRAVPLGGYCSFEGENDGEDKEQSEADKSDSFNSKKPWQRIIVLLAGATMNYILALILIIICFFSFGQACYKVNAVEESETYSSQYSLCAGDIIVGAEGRDIYFAPDMMKALNGKTEGEEVTLSVIREGERTDIEIVLRSDCSFNNSSETSKIWRALGADIYEGEDGNEYWNISSQNVRFGFFETLGRSFVYSFRIAGAIFRVLGELLTGDLGLSAMGGPLTTIKVTGEAAVQGMQSFLQIAAYIGVNLAVFNLLPIPALDGSKIVFCLIEWIFKRPVPRKVEAAIHAAGLILIIAFAVLVDVLQFVS